MRLLFECPEVNIAIGGKSSVVQDMAEGIEAMFHMLGYKYKMTVIRGRKKEKLGVQ